MLRLLHFVAANVAAFSAQFRQCCAVADKAKKHD
jgi:hypothetical protein